MARASVKRADPDSKYHHSRQCYGGTLQRRFVRGNKKSVFHDKLSDACSDPRWKAGADNPNYKGGRFVRSDGYVSVSVGKKKSKQRTTGAAKRRRRAQERKGSQ